MAKKKQIQLITAIHCLSWTDWLTYDQAIAYASTLANFEKNREVYQEAARRLTKK